MKYLDYFCMARKKFPKDLTPLSNDNNFITKLQVVDLVSKNLIIHNDVNSPTFTETRKQLISLSNYGKFSFDDELKEQGFIFNGGLNE